ncbi:hypothetical protein Tco_0723736 [Tanacetum coccineum]
MDYEQLFVEFNVGAARQTCHSYEVRLRLEHELRGRKKFKGKCAMQANWLKERDAEIASLKAQLSLKEAKATKAIRLHGQVTTVEAVKATRVNELNGLKERTMALKGQVAALEFMALSCDELSVKDASLESEKDKLAVQVSTLEAICSGVRDEVSGLESELMEMALHMDEEFYPRYLTTIAGRRSCIDKGMQDGLTADIDHGKVGRGLVDVAAYNPSSKANYVSTINALRAVDFSLLAKLES